MGFNLHQARFNKRKRDKAGKSSGNVFAVEETTRRAKSSKGVFGFLKKLTIIRRQRRK